jgi:phosphoribosylanthranilate isomerase
LRISLRALDAAKLKGILRLRYCFASRTNIFAQDDRVEMTWIKICGMTNLEDALVAVDAGADAVGFVFYEKSPRCVSVETAREICAKLPEGVERIGVFVSGQSVEPWDVRLETGLNGVQWYPLLQESVGARKDGGAIEVSLLPKNARSMMALPMGLIGESEEGIRSLAASFENFGKDIPKEHERARETLNTVVLDSGDLKQPGGTGKQFDWARAVPIAEAMKRSGTRMVVAGGLTAENVVEAIQILKPWGVDVASGVEARPGKKDPDKVRAFVRAVREMDRKTC